MCQRMKNVEFRKMISVRCGSDRRVSSVLEYLKMTGHVMEEGQLVDCDDDLDNVVKGMLEPISIGDIVFVLVAGFYLVTDTRPAAAPNGDHFRALAVTFDGEGKCVIKADRSRLFQNSEAVRVRKSSFNMQVVEKYSKERYLAYQRIDEIDAQLAKMREKEG